MPEIIYQIKQKRPNLGFLGLVFILVLVLFNWLVLKVPQFLKFRKEKPLTTSSTSVARACWDITPSPPPSCSSCSPGCWGGPGPSCGCTCGCFSKGTLVAVKKQSFIGYVSKRIEEIKSGDQILTVSFNSKTPKLVRTRVSSLLSHEKRPWSYLEITTESGFKIVSTHNHRFIINEKNEALRADELNTGMKILVLRNGGASWEKVTNFRPFIKKNSVYNLEVASLHSYLVSSDGQEFTLVHNDK